MNALFTDRRGFLRHFTLGSAWACVAGGCWQARVLAEILPGPAGTLVVNLNDYPALATDYGSVRINFAGAAYPVMLNRAPGNVFHAMDSDCPHQNNVVQPYDPARGYMICTHGSQYAIDGTLLGGPSPRSLTPFETSYDGGNLVSIRIPGLGFAIRQIAVQVATAGTTRWRLTFPTLGLANYRVQYRAELDATPQTVPFATSPAGAANQTTLLSFGGDKTVYVDAAGTRGFFTVELVASPY
jgi:nitrite reductase/ring-hydroxylating ferredoxin subunit